MNGNAPSPARRLEDMLNRIGAGGLRSLAQDEVLELGRTYRRTSALLARARTAGLAGPEVENLNRLLARAYPLVHGPPQPRPFRVLHFLLHEFPAAVRREARFVLAAWAFFLAGAMVGAVAVELWPDVPDLLLGPGWKQGLEQVAERHVGDQDWLPASMRPQASAAIMTNNIQVSFLAFASGVPLCLGSAWLLAYNGLMLGAIAVVVQRAGSALNFWAFVLPHGVTELSAIMIAGGAGLVLGYSLISPGRRRRGDALRDAGRRAAPLLLGVVLMLIVAGLIEGFVSPVPSLPPVAKIAFALATALWLALWFALGGRGLAGHDEAAAAPRG